MRSWHGSLYISDSVLIDVFRAHLKVRRKAAHTGKQHSNYLGRECAKDQIDVWKFKSPAMLALETIDAPRFFVGGRIRLQWIPTLSLIIVTGFLQVHG